MEEMDFTVDHPQESVQDDAVQASEGTQGISEILNEGQEGAQAPQDGSSDGREESGGIKGRLMAADQKGYKRGQNAPGMRKDWPSWKSMRFRPRRGNLPRTRISPKRWLCVWSGLNTVVRHLREIRVRLRRLIPVRGMHRDGSCLRSLPTQMQRHRSFSSRRRTSPAWAVLT